MATLVLSALGASVGGAVGGSVLGLSSAVIGRAVGATVGRLIDARLLGAGSEPVPTGKVERFRLTAAGEGAPVDKVFGRMRVAGQVIWASRFREEIRRTGGGGKGGGGGGGTAEYSYSVSLAIALGEGVVARVGRIWADGIEVSPEDFDMRVYPGDETQMPDPKIAAVEGDERAPAFRGTAYVVFEDLDLGRFGNRVPQFSFEVLRRAAPPGGGTDPALLVPGVALIPGTGEYALATTPVQVSYGPGQNRAVNVNAPGGRTDYLTSMTALREELPACRAVSLVVSWFGDDLRCGQCRIEPRVEQADFDGVEMPWEVSGTPRSAARLVGQRDGKPVFGGTTADRAVIEAIREMNAAGQEVMFYPFILMDIQPGNGLTDPWTGEAEQPPVPWRGRITLSVAPGRAGSPDGTAAADAEVAAFFGQAQPGDFQAADDRVTYTGPAEWSYRRFILHYAHLCRLAGGVESFCIGTELRSLTQIRGAGGFPVVAALVQLARDVRAILGPEVKIGYAADWSEYFGYHPADGSGDVYFHLDPLWADPDIDFIGIDNYMPLSDWREGDDHLDAGAGAIHALDYLKGNIEGGEGYDWYYASEAARDAQIRTPITDAAHGEPWVWRYKDIRGWWENRHHERIGGVRQAQPTAWEPGLKPIRFTEIGCAAIDKGTNQPNAFWDAKSSESMLPRYSTGARDDLIQAQYLRAMLTYWREPGKNPVSAVYGGPMLDMDHTYVWAWDARPWPAFPQNTALWDDGANWARGHWLNGRLGAQALADVIAELCADGGVAAVDVGGVYGSVAGYRAAGLQTGRARLQPLLLAHGVDAIEAGGVLRFRKRDGRVTGGVLDPERLVWEGDSRPVIEVTRAGAPETVGKVQIGHVRADGSYEAGSAGVIMPDDPVQAVSGSELPMVLTEGEATTLAARWLAEARQGREEVGLTLPPSAAALVPGDVVELPESAGGGRWRIDRIEEAGLRRVTAVRVADTVYRPVEAIDEGRPPAPWVAPVPVLPLFLDLPLITGDEVPHAPHLAVAAVPWPGTVAVYDSVQDAGYVLNSEIRRPSVIGVTETALPAAAPDRWDRGPGVEVTFSTAGVSSASVEAVLNGANLAAIGSGTDDVWELFQFTEAVLVGANRYLLKGLLRGQAGTEGAIGGGTGGDWPAGSHVVLIDGAPQQVVLPASARNMARHWRVGPATRPYTDASYVHVQRAFAGIGLRPYAPAHLKARRAAGGDLSVSWIRRTRIDGDSWDLPEVPLGEAVEAYQVTVLDGAGAVLRVEQVGAPAWTYTAAMQAADGVSGAFAVEVAQISDRFGPGAVARMEIDG